jgi:DNA-binding winged helix-turn-helix (wHTH) protein/TolB-like protein/tetratricopeptide (TPR) repeat protein
MAISVINDRPTRYYEFGPFRLSMTDRLLMRDEKVVSLTPKLVDTLILLVENNGHVLTKNALMEALWPDSFVEESSLTQNISLLRKALSENGEGQQYIETVPKRGYRFIATVREKSEAYDPDGATELLLHERTSTQVLIEEHFVPESVPVSDLRTANLQYTSVVQKPTRRNYRLYAAAAVLLVVSVALLYLVYRSRLRNPSLGSKSIAVLPFKTIGTQSESELMGLGMADAVILRLNHLEGTVVLPTSSVFRYTTREKDALSIAKDLGVEAVLDGTVQRDGDRIRVSAQLIRSSDGKALWSETFDEPYKDIFALQDSISERMTAAIGRELLKKPPSGLSTTNLEAHQAYLTGVYFWNKRTKANLSKAIEYFELAVQKDPSFVQAQALLADCYYLASQDGYHLLSMEESFRRAGEVAERALALDDQVAEAHVVRAAVLWSQKKFDEADHEYRRGLEINPNYATGHLRYGYFLFAMQKPQEALNKMRRSQQLDPVSPTSNTALAYMLFMTRDIEGSIRFNKKALELQSEFVGARYNLGVDYLQKQMFSEAIVEFERLREAEPALATLGLAKAHALSGDKKAAANSLADFERATGHELTSRIELAILYSCLGDNDRAFEWLEQIPSTGALATTRLKFDPQLDLLRKDSRFNDLLMRRQTGNQAMRRGL